ncbi:MAG: AAA family ATPase [Deltaproteobacteria bacterium]|nr:AAA family ATPase [Deltaproteobacteria bacterium]
MPEKGPLQPGGRHAKSNDPTTWSSFEQSSAAFVAGLGDGVGFVFSSEDDIVGIDIDKVLDEAGNITDPTAADLVAKTDSYTEISPSGKGLHIYAKGTLPAAAKTEGLEVYTQGRYFTVTGRRYRGTPDTIEWRQEAIDEVVAEVRRRQRAKRKDAAKSSTRLSISDDSGKVVEGGRNDAVYLRGVKLKKNGFTHPEIRAAVRAYNEAACDPPLGAPEIDQIVDNVLRNVTPGEIEAGAPPRTWPYFLGGEADGFAEQRYVVDDLIHEDTVGMIFGKQGSLKTQLAMDIGAHVAQGIPYLGRDTTRGAVLYVAAEGSGAIQKRVAGIYHEHPNLPFDAFVGISAAVNLASSEESDAFAEFIVSTILQLLSMPIRIVEYDTMSKSVPGESDSDDSTITELERNVRTIARKIGAVADDGFVPASILVHHPRKNDSAYRGSGAIEGNFDMIIHVEKTEAEKLEDRLFEVTLDKVKDGPTDCGWAYRASLVHVGTTPGGKKNCRRKLPQTVQHIIELIVRIQTRDGRKLVPGDVLQRSGFTAYVADKEWDPQVPIAGVRLDSLRDAFMHEDGDAGRSSDGEWTIPDKARKRWDRRVSSMKKSDAVWICDGWVWLAGE